MNDRENETTGLDSLIEEQEIRDDDERSPLEIVENADLRDSKIDAVVSFGRHRAWKKNMAELVSVQGSETVLNLCCGSGDMALELIEIPTVKSIIGVDTSEDMLAVARDRAMILTEVGETHPKAEFVQGQPMKLQFQDESFDCVVISMGLRNTEQPSSVLREAYRVLKPGGLFLNLDLCRPKGFLARLAFLLVFNIIAPVTGGRHRQDFREMPRVIEEYYAADELSALLRWHGFQDIGCKMHMPGLAAMHLAEKWPSDRYEV